MTQDQNLLSALKKNDMRALLGRSFPVADFMEQDEEGKSALYWLAERKHLDSLDTLLEKGAKLPRAALLQQDKRQETPLHVMAEKGNLHRLIPHIDKADPLTVDDFLIPSDKDGQTALHLLPESNSLKYMRDFLGSNPLTADAFTQKDDKGTTPLQNIAHHGQMRDLNILLFKKVQIPPAAFFEKDAQNASPFGYSCMQGELFYLKSLLPPGHVTEDHLKLQDGRDCSNLSHIAKKEEIKHLKSLMGTNRLSAATFCETNEYQDESPLMSAAFKGELKEASSLLKDGETFTPEMMLATNRNGQSALSLAAWRGLLRDVKDVIAPAKFTKKDLTQSKGRQSPLQLAAKRGRLKNALDLLPETDSFTVKEVLKQCGESFYDIRGENLAGLSESGILTRPQDLTRLKKQAPLTWFEKPEVKECLKAAAEKCTEPQETNKSKFLAFFKGKRQR